MSRRFEVISALAITAAVAAAVAVAGCDLVFPPGSRASDAGTGPFDASGDGPSSDGALDAAETFDSEPADASLPDSGCAAACNAPDQSAGIPNPGVASCTQVTLCTSVPALDLVELCSCTAGLPELYVVRSSGTADIGLVAPLPPTPSYSLTVDGGGCLGGGVACTADSPCPSDIYLWIWMLVPMTAGTHTFQFHDDDGSGCHGGGPTFTVNVQ